MQTLKKYNGFECVLSTELYELLEDVPFVAIVGYTKGTEVRLISGVDNEPIIGHHFRPEYVTVCRVDATTAELVGVHKSKLKRV